MRFCVASALLLVACHGHGAGASPVDASPAAEPSVVWAPVIAPTASDDAALPVPVLVASAAVVPTPPPASSTTFPVFRRTPMPIEDVAKLVTAAPELSRVGTEIAYFDPGDGSYIVRSSADHAGVAFTTQPLLWSPEPGQQVLVVAARGKAASFVAAWWLLPDGGYRLASTFVMLGEIAPVALAYRPAERALFWTSCWLCPGETGHVSVREDHHIVIVQD
jgi:hypothetical protein